MWIVIKASPSSFAPNVLYWNVTSQTAMTSLTKKVKNRLDAKFPYSSSHITHTCHGSKVALCHATINQKKNSVESKCESNWISCHPLKNILCNYLTNFWCHIKNHIQNSKIFGSNCLSHHFRSAVCSEMHYTLRHTTWLPQFPEEVTWCEKMCRDSWSSQMSHKTLTTYTRLLKDRVMSYRGKFMYVELQNYEGGTSNLWR